MSQESLQTDTENTQVLVLAGGKAKRMGIDFPKCLLDFGSRKLIDICIELLAKEKFKEFVFLLGYKHQEVLEYIADGSKYGISVKYSIEPQNTNGFGKGKALKYAIKNGHVDLSKRSIIVFPDDILLERGIYSRFLVNHLSAVRKFGALASLILVSGAEYPYGVAEVSKEGMVQHFIEKPLISKPTSIGIYLFESEVYDIIAETVDLDTEKTVELESTIFPILAQRQKLFAFFIPYEKWLPVNTLKEYERALKALSPRVLD